ncbi:MAG: Hpt domain-containing protein [Arhodomonas sp.]|nr:Hpt domain-containing protein [Arhodomonas sp.]
MTAVRETYRLDTLAGEAADSGDEMPAEGADIGAFRTVATVLREDVAAIKDSLDLHVRAADADEDRLREAARSMERVSDTLGVLGLEAARTTLREHAGILSGGAADEGAIMAAAEALLYVETELARFGRGGAGNAEDHARSAFEEEYHSIQTQALDEAIREMEQIQALVSRALESPEGADDTEIVQRFRGIQGVGRVLDLERFATLAGRAGAATRVVLQAAREGNDESQDEMADAITSLEYYLEALRDGRREVDRILDVAESVLDRLAPEDAAEAAAPPTPALSVVPTDGKAGTEEASVEGDLKGSEPDEPGPPPLELLPDDDAVAADTQAPEERPAKEAPAPPVSDTEGAEAAAPESATHYAAKRGPVDLDVPLHSEAMDEEILEIFLEELEEVLQTLDESFPRWCADPDDEEALVTTRRMFHTLKGSGRLAGLLLLGELAWSAENLLNRILDGSRAADGAVRGMVDETIAVVRELGRLAGQDPSSVPTELREKARALMARSADLAEGVAATEQAPPAVATGEDEDRGGAADRLAADDRREPGAGALPTLDPTLYDSIPARKRGAPGSSG